MHLKSSWAVLSETESGQSSSMFSKGCSEMSESCGICGKDLVFRDLFVFTNIHIVYNNITLVKYTIIGVVFMEFQ